MNPVLEPNEVERMVEDTLSDVTEYLEAFSPEDQAQVIHELTEQLKSDIPQLFDRTCTTYFKDDPLDKMYDEDRERSVERFWESFDEDVLAEFRVHFYEDFLPEYLETLQGDA